MPERHDAVEFCSDGSEGGPYRAAYDRSVVSPSEAVVLVLTEAEGGLSLTCRRCTTS